MQEVFDNVAMLNTLLIEIKRAYCLRSNLPYVKEEKTLTRPLLIIVSLSSNVSFMSGLL